MNALETRFYTLEEIGAAVNRNPHGGQFKRDVERDLKQWGYEWQWQPRKGVTITGRKMTPKLRLKELFFDRLDLDSQINITDFAYFLSAFYVIDGFGSMPKDTCVKRLEEFCGRLFSKSTLYRWTNKLCESGNAVKIKKGALWKTTKDKHGIKHQEPVDPDSAEYKEFCSVRTATLKQLEEEGIPPDKRWSEMIHRLFVPYAHYYYCPEICLNAFGENAQEITELVSVILEERKK